MGLSRYGAKGREGMRPAQGVTTRAIKDALILSLVALLSFCVTQAKFQHWRYFYQQIVAFDKFFYQEEFHVLTLVSLHLHDIPLQ